MATKNAQVRRNGPSKRSRRGTSRAIGTAAVAVRSCRFGRFRAFGAFRRRRSTRISTPVRESVVFYVCRSPIHVLAKQKHGRGNTSTATRRMGSIGTAPVAAPPVTAPVMIRVTLMIPTGIATPAAPPPDVSSRRRLASPVVPTPVGLRENSRVAPRGQGRKRVPARHKERVKEHKHLRAAKPAHVRAERRVLAQSPRRRLRPGT